MTFGPIIFLTVILAVVAGGLVFAGVEYEALIAYGDPRPGDVRADVRAIDDASLLAYLEHRRRWRWWFKLRSQIARIIERRHADRVH
jgi:hypothetical protein